MWNVGVSPKAVFSLIVLFSLVIAVFYHMATVEGYKAKLASTERDLVETQAREQQLRVAVKTAVDANARFEQSVLTQNEHIAALRREAELLAQASEEALAKAREQRKREAQTYRPIVFGPPAQADNLCASLEDRLRRYNAARVAELAK